MTMRASVLRRDKNVALHEALRLIASSNTSVVEPSISFSTGVIYPIIVKVAAQYGISESEVLEELNRLGVFEKEPHETLVSCPNCNSIRLFSKLHCPGCGSDNLMKTLILTHATCGGLNVLEEAEKTPNCTKCGKPLHETKVIGTLYQCRNCGARFEAPLPAWRCADCRLSFDYKQNRYMTIYRYKVNKDKIQTAEKQLLVSLALEGFADLGLKVASAPQVKGKSGYFHSVDLALTGGLTPLYVDIVPDSPRALGEALSSIAKTTDLDGEHIIFIPKTLEKSVASAPGGNVLFYENARDLLQKTIQLQEKLKVKKR